MTLLPRMLLAQQGSDAKIPAEDFRLALGGLLSPGPGTALACMSGVLAGTGSSGVGCDVTSPSAGSLQVAAGNFVIQRSTGASGAYIGTIDTPTTVSITSLPGAGQFKAGYLIAHAYDEAYGDTQDGAQLEVVLGTAAGTVAAALYPTVPTNAVVLAGFTVTSTGTVSFTSTAVRVVARGGIVPVVTGDGLAGDYSGQWRDEPQLGLQRWSGSSWYRPHAMYWGAGTAYPSTPQFGDTFQHTGLGCLMRYGANGWRQAEEVPVADATGRNAISSGWAGALHPGFRVWQSDISSPVEWTGSAWYKLPSSQSLIYSVDGSSMPSSGVVVPGASGTGIINGLGPIPAHTPGPIRIELTTEAIFQGSGGNSAGRVWLSLGDTAGSPNYGQLSAPIRFHTGGTTTQNYMLALSAQFTSNGSAKYIWVIGSNDAASSYAYVLAYGGTQVWQP